LRLFRAPLVHNSRTFNSERNPYNSGTLYQEKPHLIRIPFHSSASFSPRSPSFSYSAVAVVTMWTRN
jgi:hypothetical protein